jgi:hypothetical protein
LQAFQLFSFRSLKCSPAESVICEGSYQEPEASTTYRKYCPSSTSGLSNKKLNQLPKTPLLGTSAHNPRQFTAPETAVFDTDVIEGRGMELVRSSSNLHSRKFLMYATTACLLILYIRNLCSSEYYCSAGGPCRLGRGCAELRDNGVLRSCKSSVEFSHKLRSLREERPGASWIGRERELQKGGVKGDERDGGVAPE